MAKARPFLIATVILFVLLLALLFLNERQSPQPMEPETYSVSSDGWKALFMTLEESGFRVSRWEKPLTGFGEPATTLVVAGPLEPINHAEADAIRRWVEAGGHLVVFSGATAGLYEMEGILAEDDLMSEFHVDASAREFGNRGGVGLDSVAVREAGKPESGPELTLEAPKPASLRVFGTATPLLVGPEGESVGVRVAAGKGAAYIFSSYDYLSNASIDHAANFEYFYRLFQSLGTSVAFDEYHHGHHAPETHAGERQVTPLWILQFLLFAALYFYAGGQRFGRIRFVPERERYRSPLEHVDAVANLYQKAGVNLEVLEDYHRYYREILYRHLGIPAKGAAVNLAQGTAVWPQVRQIEDEYTRLGAQRPLRAEALTQFAGRIEKLKEALSK